MTFTPAPPGPHGADIKPGGEGLIGGGDEGNEETTGADAWDSVEGKWHKLWEGTNLWWVTRKGNNASQVERTYQMKETHLIWATPKQRTKPGVGGQPGREGCSG